VFQSNNNNQCISSTSSFHCVPGLPNQYLVQVTTSELPVWPSTDRDKPARYINTKTTAHYSQRYTNSHDACCLT